MYEDKRLNFSSIQSFFVVNCSMWFMTSFMLDFLNEIAASFFLVLLWIFINADLFLRIFFKEFTPAFKAVLVFEFLQSQINFFIA